uniref:Neurotransmitter-gated ion-channel ligand-binding domain-containing protein n=1 Tax=Aplanochytrium stocchinoi TaxID=215587 RepID=A0A7S3V3K3_9STRA
MTNSDIVVQVDAPKQTESGGSDENPDLQVVGVATELRLLSVDDANETFVVALLIHAHYEDPESFDGDHASPDVFKRNSEYDGFIPEFTMVNCVDTQFDSFQVTVRTNQRTGEIWSSHYNTCTISESLELEKFPFDRQLFRVVFKSPNSALKQWEIDVGILDFLPDFKNGKRVENTSQYLVSCELKSWTMADFKVGQFKEDVDPASLTGGEMEITIMAERSPLYFFINFVLVMYLIVATNFANVSVSPSDSADRLATTITLLLTLVAFKFVLADAIPKVGYLTYMDKYVLTSYFFLMISIVENVAVTPRFLCYLDKNGFCNELETAEFEGDATDTDFYFQIIFLVAWTFENIIVAIFSFKPQILQESWKKVQEGQIGETESSVKRTSVVEDLDLKKEQLLQ